MPDRARWIVPALLLLALVLRLGFVLSLPETPLYWDERLYNNWAKVYQKAWAWVLGAAPAPPAAKEFRAGLQKGGAYTASVGLVYALAGAQPRIVLLVQAVLDTLTCYFVYALARAVGGLRAGLSALILAALYEPSIFTAARLQTETFAVCACAAALWALCFEDFKKPTRALDRGQSLQIFRDGPAAHPDWVPDRRRGLGHLAAGGAVAVAMLAKPVLQFLFPVLLATVPARNSDRPWSERGIFILLFAAGFLAVVGPRLVMTTAIAGRPMIADRGDPGPELYSGAILENAGWKTDYMSFAHPPREELLAVLENKGRSDAKNHLTHATLRTWALHPLSSAAVALHKLYVAWLYPYNDSDWVFLTDRGRRSVWHGIVLGLGLIGLPLSLRRWRVSLPMVVATLYLWLTYLMAKIEVRYAFPAVAFTIGFAGIALGDLSRGWQLAWRAGARRRLAILAASCAACVGAALLLSVDRLLQVLPVSATAAAGLRMVVMVGAAAVLTVASAELLRHLWRRRVALAVLAPSFAVAALIVLFGRPLAHSWHEWQSTLAPHHGRIRQEFLLPEAAGRPVSARLKLDLLPGGAHQYDVVVWVNGAEARRYPGGMTRSDADLPRTPSYGSLFVARRRTVAPDKAWYTVPIDAGSLVPGQPLSIEIALEGDDPLGGSLVVFGDHTSGDNVYAGPSLFSPAVNADTSIFKYLAVGDFRMRRSIRLSGSSRSRFHDGTAWSEEDLAFDAGRQEGRYRIFLLLEYPNGTAVL